MRCRALGRFFLKSWPDLTDRRSLMTQNKDQSGGRNFLVWLQGLADGEAKHAAVRDGERVELTCFVHPSQSADTQEAGKATGAMSYVSFTSVPPLSESSCANQTRKYRLSSPL